MRSMNSIPFLGGHFNQFWPLVGVVFSILIFFRFFDRIAAGLGLSAKFKFDEDQGEFDRYSDRGRQLLVDEQDAVSRGLQVGDIIVLQMSARTQAKASEAETTSLLGSLRSKLGKKSGAAGSKSEASEFLSKLKAEREKDGGKMQETQAHKVNAKKWLEGRSSAAPSSEVLDRCGGVRCCSARKDGRLCLFVGFNPVSLFRSRSDSAGASSSFSRPAPQADHATASGPSMAPNVEGPTPKHEQGGMFGKFKLPGLTGHRSTPSGGAGAAAPSPAAAAAGDKGGGSNLDDIFKSLGRG